MSLSCDLMKKSCTFLFLALFMLGTGTAAVAAKVDLLQLGGMPVIGPIVSIQVPLLTKPVTLDGKFTTTDEWSDTVGNDLTLMCASTNCGNAPTSSVPAKAWLKHDNTWLYYLFQANYTPPSGAPPAETNAGPEYLWGISGNQYSHHNWYAVCPGFCFFDGFYDSAQRKNVNDPNSNLFQPPIVQGYGAFSGNRYTFELQVLLNSGQADHWNLAPGKTYGVPGSDGLMFLTFSAQCAPVSSECGTFPSGFPATWDYYRSVTLSLLTTAIAVPTTATTAQKTASISPPVTGTSTTGMTGGIIGQAQFGDLWLLGPVALVIVVASVLIVRRRKTSATTAAVIEKPAEGTVQKLSAEPSIPTGYRELDGMLAGGLPEGYAIGLVSQSYDERDLLVRKIIQSSLASGRPTFYLSNDIARTRDLTTRFSQNFFALSPMAEKIATDRPNLLKIPDVGDLSNLNISAHEIIETKSGSARSKLIVIDLLTDLLLRNKVLTTRRWLTDFISRRKATGFTLVATLDPSVASKEEVQAIVGVFDGVIEFFEKELQERARRFLVIKKMYGREYSDSELMLDRKALIE